MEEDSFLPKCQHEWADTYTGSGLSQETPDKTILYFYCTKCLAIRMKVIDTSGILISPETKELYDNGSDKATMSES